MFQLLLFLRGFSAQERQKLAHLMGISLASGLGNASCLNTLFEEHLVKEGINRYLFMNLLIELWNWLNFYMSNIMLFSVIKLKPHIWKIGFVIKCNVFYEIIIKYMFLQYSKEPCCLGLFYQFIESIVIADNQLNTRYHYIYKFYVCVCKLYTHYNLCCLCIIL